MSFPRYPAYKESGFGWVERIPAHWDCLAGRRVFRQVRELPIDGDVQLSATQKYGVVPQTLFMELEDQKVALALGGVGNFKRVKENDFVISLRSFQGGIEHSKYNGCVSPAYTVLRLTIPCQPAYLAYLLKSPGYVIALQSVTDGIRDGKNISYEQFGVIGLPIPSLDEQQAIATFLDHETTKIDALVAEQERLIDLLKEKRQAVISHAVTKGLDPSVPMKDSGVEWLGEVPAHWGINSIRHILNAIGDVDHVMPASVEKGVPYLMTGDLKELVSDVKLDDCKQVDQRDYFDLTRKIKTSKGDVVMARYATIGTLMYVDVDVDFLVSYSCVTLKTNEAKVSGSYLFHYMKSDAFRQSVEHKINTNTQGNVGIKDLQSVKIVVPPIDEQPAIVAFLNSEVTKFNDLEAESERAITLLQERRTALISAAVTGQIDVRGCVPREASA